MVMNDAISKLANQRDFFSGFLSAARGASVHCVQLTVWRRDCFVPRKDGLAGVMVNPIYTGQAAGLSDP